jgi:AcrR family transcriptional regulator
MVRSFTGTERVEIRRRLFAAARETVPQVGIRGTTVENLSRRAGISKGAFYLFFPSKERLIIELLLAVETDVRQQLIERVERPDLSPETRISEFLRFIFGLLDDHPILRLLSDPDEAAALFRSVPQDELKARMADDDRIFVEIYRRWRRKGWIAKVDPMLFAALPRVAMGIAQEREAMGNKRYRRIVELIIESVAERLSC